MKRFLLLGTMLGAVLLTSSMARADNYAIDYTTTAGISADLIVSASQTPTNGPFMVYAVSGERNGFAITGLSSYAESDQLLFAAAPYVDFSGLSFSTAQGDYNLFSNNLTAPYDYAEIDSTIDSVGYPQNGVLLTSLSVTDVPEPASLALLGLGLAGLGIMRHRRRDSIVAA